MNTSLDIMNTSANTMNTTSLYTMIISANTTNTSMDTMNTSASTMKTLLDTMDTSANTMNTSLDIRTTSSNIINTSLDIMSTSSNTMNTWRDTMNTSANTVNTWVDTMNTSASTMNTSLDTMNTWLDTTDTSVTTMNTSMETDDIWWIDEDYGLKWNKMDPFTYWLERNEVWIILAIVGTVVAVAWIITNIKVFPNEIRDLYSTTKVHFNHTCSSWRKMCTRKNNNANRTRCNARSFQTGEDPKVLFQVEGPRAKPDNETRSRATKSQSGAYQQQNGAKRRTRVKIVDEIYGQNVGYQNSAGPSFQGREKTAAPRPKATSENPRRKHLNHNSNNRETESRQPLEIRPRCHVKGRNLREEENRVAVRPRYNSETANSSSLNISPAKSARASRVSTSNSLVTPDSVRMMEIARCVKFVRERPHKARQARLMKPTEEQQHEDLNGTWV